MNNTMRPIYLLIILLTNSLSSNAQGERDNWMFGNYAGVSFSTSPPASSALNSSSQLEGVADISTPSGDLLFYSNGINVWNKDHIVMTNGSGLLGHETFSQGVSIIKRPFSDSLYYLFTLNFGPNLYDPGEFLNLSFTEVDISLDGGLGEVINATKNTPIRSSRDLKEHNKIIQHANGYDYWLVVSKVDGTYLSYLITCEGISTTPVESAVGNSTGLAQPIGCLAVNPGGTKIAASANSLGLEVFDFNSTTGVLSNRLDLPILGQDFYYGVAFSPNGELIYATTSALGPALSTSLFQFNLSAGSPSDIATSGNLIALSLQTNPGDGIFGQMTMGKDNKLYVADFSHDPCQIQNPNIVGSGCGFVNGAIDISPGNCRAGLPNYPNKMPQEFPDNLVSINSAEYCFDEGIQILTSTYEGGAWSGVGIIDDSTGVFDPTIAGIGVHEITYTVSTPCKVFSDSIQIEISDCNGENPGGTPTAENVILEIPNVITPNGDFINDVFQPIKISGIEEMKTTIINRWGNTLFQSENLSILWDGSNAADGVYFWMIQYTDIYGNSDNKRGHVTVINN